MNPLTPDGKIQMRYRIFFGVCGAIAIIGECWELRSFLKAHDGFGIAGELLTFPALVLGLYIFIRGKVPRVRHLPIANDK